LLWPIVGTVKFSNHLGPQDGRRLRKEKAYYARRKSLTGPLAVSQENNRMIPMIRVTSLVNKGQESTSRKICAWCNKLISEGTEPISHGICPACTEREMAKYLGAKSIEREEDPTGFNDSSWGKRVLFTQEGGGKGRM
jgi:hypothetical protein